MILIYLIIFLIIVLSVVSFCFHLYKFIKILLCRKVSARIIQIDSHTNKWGIYNFHYLIMENGETLKLSRDMMPIKLQFLSISVHSYIGKEVFVPYDEKNNKLLEHIVIVFAKLLLSVVLTILWSVCLVMLYVVINA